MKAASQCLFRHLFANALSLMCPGNGFLHSVSNGNFPDAMIPAG